MGKRLGPEMRRPNRYGKEVLGGLTAVWLVMGLAVSGCAGAKHVVQVKADTTSKTAETPTTTGPPTQLTPPPSQPPESIPQGIISDASTPFPSSEVAVENVWQVVYAGDEVQVYLGAAVNGDYSTALSSATSQGLAIVVKSPYGSPAADPTQVNGTRFMTPQKSGALRAVSATATTVTATTPDGAKFTYDVTTGKFTPG